MGSVAYAIDANNPAQIEAALSNQRPDEGPILLTAALVNKKSDQFTISPPSPSAIRIKDMVHMEGVRQNQLVGYGLVVGLNGTGDDLGSTPQTQESVIAMLERMGVNIRPGTGAVSMKGKNIAAVIVTATLPPFARQGSKIDINVSAMGNAKDLKGGTLLVTPLKGADGEVYAVGQGSIAVGGFTAGNIFNAPGGRGGGAGGGLGQQVTKGVPTSGSIPNGAIVEKEIDFELANLNRIRFQLRNPDFTVASRLARTVNNHFQALYARALDNSTIDISIPQQYKGRIVELLANIEQLKVEPDQIAKVIIDDHNGVIVMGENVRISSVAVSHGSITVKVTENPLVTQPGMFANGQTVTLNQQDVTVKEESSKFTVLPEGTTVRELINALNSLGVSTRDIIVILQNIKAACALQADLEVR